jgi:imidazole glycerol phosphate synthase subunit HisF
MTELILMLTKDDVTIADCLSAYEQVRATDVKWVGFKDIGQAADTLDELTRRIHADGRRAVLEVVSEDEQAEMRSVVPELIREVVAAVDIPVVAGSIDAPARFAAVRNAGAWGLTVGTAAVTGQLMPGGSFRDQVNTALRLTMSA